LNICARGERRQAFIEICVVPYTAEYFWRSTLNKPEYEEFICTIKPERLEDVNEAGYLTANPDVVEAGMTAKDHFTTSGHKEGRMQWMNQSSIAATRDRKLSSIQFRRAPIAARKVGEPIDFFAAFDKARIRYTRTAADFSKSIRAMANR